MFLILLFLQTFVVSRISSTERLQTLGEQMFALLPIHLLTQVEKLTSKTLIIYPAQNKV